MLDLESELTASGLFHHETKRRHTQAQTLVTQAHGIAWSMLRKIDDRRPAVQRQDGRGVSDHQRLYPVGGLKGLTTSCCRCVGSSASQRSISGRYDFNPAKPLVRIPALLECIGIEDCKIDGIIELNLID